MKAWLGLRDTDLIYDEAPAERGLFGLDQRERNHARIRIG